MNFSAKQVISFSAKKLWWIRKHGNDTSKEHLYAEARKIGEEYQSRLAESLFRGNCEIEMGGFITIPETNDRIYFSNDIVALNGNAIVECKMPLDFGSTDEFLKKSILQCAFYSFLSDQCTILQKAAFACQEGVERASIRLKDNFTYILAFGHELYEIKVNNPYNLWNYLKGKIINSIDWNDAVAFEEHNPLKYQFEMLNHAFEYKKIG